MEKADVRWHQKIRPVDKIRRSVVGLLALTALLLALGGVASAQPDPIADLVVESAAQAGEPTLELAVLGAVPYGPGISVPIEVTIVSPRAARGTVQVRLSQRSSTILTVPVDVPANTPVRLPLAVPSSYDGINIEATVSLDGIAEVTETLQRWGGDATATVGLIGVESVGETIGLGIDGGSAAVRELDDASIRSAGLSQVGNLVISPGGLRGLSPETQDLVLGWLGSGGEATIVGAPGSIDDLLPADWRGGLRPGIGRIAYADANWSTSLRPAATSGSGGIGSPEFVFGEAAFDLNLNGVAELAVDAGLGLLGARSLLIFLGIYALIAGPLMYLLLKRLGRLSLAWTALPALAVVFTVAAVVVGAGIRGDRNDSHATIVEVQPTGSTARSSVLLTSSFRGGRTVELPAGWQMIAAGDLSGNGSSAPISLRPDRDRTDVTMELDAGGAGVATFEGGAPMFDDVLRIIDVAADDSGLVSGRVKNGADVALTDVVAFAGGGVAEVGTIEAGQTVDFTVEFAAPFDGSRRVNQTEFAFWPAPRWGESPEQDTSVGASNWGQWRVLEGLNTFAPGTVGIVGWSDAFDSPAADIATGRTGLVARIALPAETAGRSEAGIGHIVVATPRNAMIENANFFGSSFMNRIDIPDPDRKYVAILGRGVAGFEVWVDEWKWMPLEDGDEVAVTLPSEAFVDGTAWIRTSVPEWAWPPTPGLSIVPSEVAAANGETAAKAVLRSGAAEYRNIDEDFDGRFGPEPVPFNEPTPIVGDVREIEDFISVVVEPGASESFTGELVGAEVDTYVIELAEGEVIGVQLRSQAHDSYLVIRDETGGRLAENDDAGEGLNGLNSQLIFEAPEAGAYLIDASELGQSGRGGYELIVERAS